MFKYPVKVIYDSSTNLYHANLFNWFCALKSDKIETLLIDISKAIAVVIDILQREGKDIRPIDISNLDYENIYYVEPDFNVLNEKIQQK